jgi:hypothetical protein
MVCFSIRWRKDVHQDLASFMILRTLLLAHHFIIIKLKAPAQKINSGKSEPVLFYSRRTSSNIFIVLRLGQSGAYRTWGKFTETSDPGFYRYAQGPVRSDSQKIYHKEEMPAARCNTAINSGEMIKTRRRPYKPAQLGVWGVAFFEVSAPVTRLGSDLLQTWHPVGFGEFWQ